MLKIAICDDNRFEAERLETMVLKEIEQMGLKAETEVFFDGGRLVTKVRKKQCYDLIFLDIEMPCLDGIGAGRYIRKVDKNVLFIYVSECEECLKELFEVETFRFLLKPVSEEELHRYFVSAVARIGEARDFYQFQFDKEIKKVQLREVLYFESRNRVIHIFLKDGTEEKFYGKLNDVEQELAGRGKPFIRIHQSYLVNYNYIKRANAAAITIDAGEKGLLTLKVSEERQRMVKARICQLAEGL